MIHRKSPPRRDQQAATTTTTTTIIHESYEEKSVSARTSSTTSATMTSSSSSSLTVAQQVWNEIRSVMEDDNNEGGGGGGTSTSSSTTKSLLNHLESGWTSDEAYIMREKSSFFRTNTSTGGSGGPSALLPVNDHDDDDDEGTFNVVRPPIDCPAWLCILLPCINHLPSMKAYKVVNPDDAEVCRSGQWIRYDAASLVVGDVIRLEEGDLIPADCIVVSVDGDDHLLVDLKLVAGLDRPKCVSNDGSSSSRTQRQLYMGGTVVQGRATALVTAIGPYSLLGTLIRQKKFPPSDAVVVLEEESSTFEDTPSSATSIQMATMA